MPTPLITWASSGLGTKTAATLAALFSDTVTLINAASPGAEFSWQVASSNFASGPYYIVLKRKNGSAGRILVVSWLTAPAGNNPSLLGQAPSNNGVYWAYFPAGSVDTPSNLTAASGAVLGDDTGSTQVSGGTAGTTYYMTNYRPFYFDSEAGVVFGSQDPANNTFCYMSGAGDLVVDTADDVAHATAFASSNSSTNYGTATACIQWTAAGPLAGSGTHAVRVVIGGVRRTLYQAYTYTGNWAAQSVGPADMLSETATSRRYYSPIALVGTVKGEGPAFKLRQIGLGSGSVGPFEAYSVSGPAVASRQFSASTAGSNGSPWMLNIKV